MHRNGPVTLTSKCFSHEFKRGFGQRGALGDAGVVDEHIDLTERVERLGDGVLVGDVADRGANVAELLQCSLVAPERDHVIAEIDELLGDRAADALGAARDDDRAAHCTITGISRSICARRSG